MSYKMLFLTFIVLFISCDKSDNNENCADDDNYCFSFDVRQCSADLFAELVSENSDQSTRESEMKSWLENQGYSVNQIKLEIGFHQAVCEACTVCPTGDRYFVLANGSRGTSFEDLNLLSVEEEDCCDIF